jgi:hypothetical protein
MNRRTLLKGFAAVPLATTLGFGNDKGADDTRHSGLTSHKLQILLDGAFAVVIQRGNLNSILAFSPRDKSEPHKFYFNDPSYAQASEKNFNFELQAEGLRHTERTEISPGFEDFQATVRRWKLTENFVAIKLPLPARIAFSGHREQVVFKTKKTGWMPTNHILEYDVTDPAKVKIVCKELDKACAPSPDSPRGLTRFFFEVGPPRGTPQGHAVKFFNDMLEASFPELVAAYSLSEILDRRDENPSRTARLVSADMRSTMPPAHLLKASYTLDCKLGGILATTTVAPG